MRSPTKTWNGARYAPEKWERNGMAPLKLSAWLIRSSRCRKLTADGWKMTNSISLQVLNLEQGNLLVALMAETLTHALTTVLRPRKCDSSPRCISRLRRNGISMLSKRRSISSSLRATASMADGDSTGLYPRISLAIRTISPSMTTWCSIWCVSFRIYQNRKATSQVSWMMPPARNARHNGTRR